ncbi:Fc.00g073080.m01.CDS01 [Cosmosporella sp. VM-42]
MYFADVIHVDIWWFVGNRLDQAPKSLPKLPTPLQGSSVVPYRYYFNTVTTSYTSPFWSWEDWELQIGWMALRGMDLLLAWIDIEMIFVDAFKGIGLTDEEIHSLLSGPAFLAWNHFGNIEGSRGGDLPFSWVDEQFELQLKIVERMAELGITPILPAFPDATIAKSPQREGFDDVYTNVTYLDPFDPHFSQLQKTFINKQTQAYGGITNFWTLDQFNENEPASGDLSYLRNVSHNTWQSLKKADPDAVWIMQGWLFSSDAKCSSNDRIETFLRGVSVNSDILILDLVSESTPQWQRTNSFYGKPWIWCQLHDYGGNMGLDGQIQNITINPIIGLQNSSSLIGFGLTAEGQGGNEIVYGLLLDQVWSQEPIDTKSYFQN